MKKHLLLVNTGTCTALYVAGDLIQQQMEGAKEFDWSRTARMATLGMCMGPLNHGWYKLLDSYLVGVTGKIVLKKVLADQLVMAPVCCSFFYMGKQGFSLQCMFVIHYLIHESSVLCISIADRPIFPMDRPDTTTLFNSVVHYSLIEGFSMSSVVAKLYIVAHYYSTGCLRQCHFHV